MSNEDLMSDFLSSVSYDETADWHSMPELGEEDDEDETDVFRTNISVNRNAKLSVALRYAFAKGRAVVNTRALLSAQSIEAASHAMSVVPITVESALLEVLPRTLEELGSDESAEALAAEISDSCRQDIADAIIDAFSEGKSEAAVERILESVGNADRADFLAAEQNEENG